MDKIIKLPLGKRQFFLFLNVIPLTSISWYFREYKASWVLFWTIWLSTDLYDYLLQKSSNYWVQTSYFLHIMLVWHEYFTKLVCPLDMYLLVIVLFYVRVSLLKKLKDSLSFFYLILNYLKVEIIMVHFNTSCILLAWKWR